MGKSGGSAFFFAISAFGHGGDMDSSNSLWILIAAIFFGITLPLLVVAAKLTRMIRILSRVENMNLRSLQRWN